MKAIDVSADQLKAYRENHQILIRDWQQSFDAYTSELARYFDVSPQTQSNHISIRKLSR
jgi:hypothetical protein